MRSIASLAVTLVCAWQAIASLILTQANVAALTVDGLPNGGLFVLGEPIRIRVAQTPSFVRYRLTDAYGAADWMVNGEVFEGEGSVQAETGGAWLLLPTNQIMRYGFYRLNLFTNRGDSGDLFIGLVDPIIRLGPDNRSPVGFILAVDPYPEFAGQIAHLGIKWVHFDVPIDADDSVLEALRPEVRAFVEQAVAYDVTPIFKLIGGAPPGAANDDSAFYQNLRSVAQAYRGQVRHWIVGNEIDGCGWWSPCDFALYATFLRKVAQTLRQVEPQTRILAADFYQGDSAALRTLLAAQQQTPDFALFDVLSVHYLEEGDGEALSPDGCCGSIETYRRTMQRYGIARPIWNTEALSPLRGGVHWPANETSYFRGGEAVPLLSPAKTIGGNLAVGAEKVFFFSYNYDQQLLDLQENPARTLTERALAVRTLADHLQTATYHSRLSGAPDFVEGHFFKNGDETILMIWSNEANRDVKATIHGADGPVDLFDPLGNVHPLRADGGRVHFRVHYEPQFLRGFTNLPTLSFEDRTNHAPFFTSQPVTTASVDRRYYYNAEAYDPDPTGERNVLTPLTYVLEEAPPGMQIDAGSGVLTWTPAQPGRFAVRVRAEDPQGFAATQSFEIIVAGQDENAAPQLLSRPRTTFGAVGLPFAYNANATDPEQGVLVYQLTQGPAWLTIDPTTGFLYGVANEAGAFPVTVRVVDAHGGEAQQQFMLRVQDTGHSPPGTGPHHIHLPWVQR
ncbi:MAG: Ig domain-containing protein [Caldilinea sp.]|nr:Ig domain-containing protein [Caldilinea sp.]MDW8439036.1 Ig domain-containing protein [Caldilineaceae bacterium]